MKRRIFLSLLLVSFAGVLPFSLTSCSPIEHNATAIRKSRPSRVGSGRINHILLKQGSRRNRRVVVDISKQKAYLLVDGKIAVTSPVSTARSGKHTPRGSFSISQKVRTGKISTIYNCEMPYWMRLSGTPFGMHAGHLPGYPASAGCVRMPASMARVFYDNLRSGTRVSICSRWSGR